MIALMMSIIALSMNGQLGNGYLQYANPLGKYRVAFGLQGKVTYGPWGINPLTSNPPDTTIFTLVDFSPAVSFGLSKSLTIGFAGVYYSDFLYKRYADAGIGELDFSLKYSAKLGSKSYISVIPEFYLPIEWSNGRMREYNTGLDYGLTIAYSASGAKNAFHFNLGAFNRDNIEQGAGLNYGYIGAMWSHTISRSLQPYLRFEYMPILTKIFYDDTSYGKSPLKIGAGLNLQLTSNFNFGLDYMLHMRTRGNVTTLSLFPNRSPSFELAVALSYVSIPKNIVGATIVGTVIDASTGKPVIADIIIPNRFIKSGADGKFYLDNVEPGELTITVHKDGYHSLLKHISVSSGEVKSVKFYLNPIKAKVIGYIFDVSTGKRLSGKVKISPDDVTLDARNGMFEVELTYGAHVINVETEKGFVTRVAVVKSSEPIKINFGIHPAKSVAAGSFTNHLPSI